MKCTHIKKNWEKCNAYAMKWSKFCYLHNPDIPDEEKKLAQAKWGKVWKTEKLNLVPLIIKDTYDITDLLVDTINKVRSGDMDVKTANCVWILCGYLMKSYEMTKLEDKLDSIKDALLT